MKVEDLTLIKTIGRGSFGEVFLTKRDGYTGYFATKRVPKDLALDDTVKKYFNNEIYILKHINHPNVVKLFEIKKTINYFFLIFDYCNGGGLSNCLAKYKKKYNTPFTEEIVQYLMRQIIKGLQYLHGQKILHRDLKLDNILLSFDNESDKENLNIMKAHIKIIDFGFARYLKDDSLAQSILGSPINMDPQILRKMKKMDNNQSFGYDMKADIWSLGTLCYELLIGSPPFESSNSEELIKKIQTGDYVIPNKLKLSKESISFLNAMLQYDPKERLDVNALAAHQFIQKNISEFEPINLKKAELKFKNPNEIILNCNSKNNIWCLFEPSSNQNLNEINPNMTDQNKLEKKNSSNHNGFKDAEEDVIGQLINNNQQQNKYPQEPIKQNNIANNDSNQQLIKRKETIPVVPEFQMDKNIENFLLQEYDQLNRDDIYVEPMLLPLVPKVNQNYTQLDN